MFFLTELNSFHIKEIKRPFTLTKLRDKFSIFVYLFAGHTFADTNHYTSLIIFDYWHFDFHHSVFFRVSLIRA